MPSPSRVSPSLSSRPEPVLPDSGCFCIAVNGKGECRSQVSPVRSVYSQSVYSHRQTVQECQVSSTCISLPCGLKLCEIIPIATLRSSSSNRRSLLPHSTQFTRAWCIPPGQASPSVSVPCLVPTPVVARPTGGTERRASLPRGNSTRPCSDGHSVLSAGTEI